MRAGGCDSPRLLDWLDRGIVQFQCQTVTVRRIAMVIGLLATVAGASAGCSVSSGSSLPTCTIANGPVTTTKNGNAYTTVPPPCSTTTSTLPAALALGTPVALSLAVIPDTVGQVSARFVVNRVWTGVTPVLAPGVNPAQFLPQSRIPPNVTWVGINLNIVNTGGMSILPGGGGRGDTPVLFLTVNGRGVSSPWPKAAVEQSLANLSELVFSVSVSGCPWAFADAQYPHYGIEPGTSASGCAAFPVPSGVKVSTIGFVFRPVEGGPSRVVQWKA